MNATAGERKPSADTFVRSLEAAREEIRPSVEVIARLDFERTHVVLKGKNDVDRKELIHSLDFEEGENIADRSIISAPQIRL